MSELNTIVTTKFIKEKALQLGYTACGIIPAEPFEDFRQALDERVKAFPQSKEIYQHMYDYVNPPEGCKSIIVCTRGYDQYKIPPALAPYVGKHYLFDGRMPYSEEFSAREEFMTYLKTLGIDLLKGEIPDRLAAARAGVGKFGRNNFTYTKEHGSYVIVCTWLVDTVLEYDQAPKETLAKECQEGCNACIEACPTNALCGSLHMDRGRCIPHVVSDTGSLAGAELREKMELWLYGCDVCQDVCPMNAHKMKEEKDFPLLEKYEKYLQPEVVLEMDEKTYINVLNPRFWYLGEKGQWLWKCNALRAMVNDGDEKYHHLIKKYSSHENPNIREVAQWGCKKLGL